MRIIIAVHAWESDILLEQGISVADEETRLEC